MFVRNDVAAQDYIWQEAVLYPIVHMRAQPSQILSSRLGYHPFDRCTRPPEALQYLSPRTFLLLVFAHFKKHIAGGCNFLSPAAMAALPLMNLRTCTKHTLMPGGRSVRTEGLCSLPRPTLTTCKPCKPFKARSQAHITCASASRNSHKTVPATSSLLEQLPKHNDAERSISSRPASAAIARSAQVLEASMPLWLLSSLPAFAADDFAQGSASTGSYYATLFLFVATLPGAPICSCHRLRSHPHLRITLQRPDQSYKLLISFARS